MDPDQIFRQHETEKKRQFASRVLRCSRLAELVATKKGESYATTIVMDQGKSVLCAAEISITLLKRFATILRTYTILFSSFF